MLVETYRIGNTVIEIYDDSFINRTEEDIKRSVRRMEAIRSKSYTEQLKRLEKSKEEISC